MNAPEFDRYADHYPELLRDPLREWFSGGRPAVFYERKRDVILSYFRRRGIDPGALRYLDVGCGKGQLLELLRPVFGSARGCDPSPRMIASVPDAKLQENALALPFSAGEFDFVTAVCVLHHIPRQDCVHLLREIRRVLPPGGTICVIEHNPYNPDTRKIVRRTPVDDSARLLKAGEVREAMLQADFQPLETVYFLYIPQPWYRTLGWIESPLRRIALGGQYAVFACAGS
jgi:SAM-dependent methyltransferase